MATTPVLPDIQLTSLRGGYNDDTPNALAEDECTQAENVEFFLSTLGERRNGLMAVDLTGSSLATQNRIVAVTQWLPANNPLSPEWLIFAASVNSSVVVSKRTSGVWADIVPNDTLNTSAPDVYLINTQELDGRDFIAAHSSADRMHLWDGTTWRRTGIAQPVAGPTGADEGSGSYSGTRYFRVRYIIQSGATILARSEPSIALTFTPSGAGAGVTLTRPALVGDNETHWEVEASVDNANFYRISTVPVGTTFYIDTTPLTSAYSAVGTLSDAIGAYLLQPSAKFVIADGDRLVWAGHWSDPTKMSQVGWSPVTNDPGVGNSERFPIVTTGGTNITSAVNLDNYEGGAITGLISAGSGVWMAFKWDHIYKAVRTNDATNAYDIITISKTRGAVPGSVFLGVDEAGAQCVYFLDPLFGPSRYGVGGLQIIKGLRNTWGRVNLYSSQLSVCGCFYPYKQQAIWWIAVDGSNVPSLGIKCQVSEIQIDEDGGANRGWSLITGRAAQATAAGILTEEVIINGVTQLSSRPCIGLTTPDFLCRTDTGDDDNGTAFTATITSRPFMVTGLLGKWGAMTATLLATANANQSVKVRLIRDLGVETTAPVVANLTPQGSETLVIQDFDNLHMSEAISVQVQFSDA